MKTKLLLNRWSLEKREGQCDTPVYSEHTLLAEPHFGVITELLSKESALRASLPSYFLVLL